LTTPVAVQYQMAKLEYRVRELQHRLLQTSTGNTADLNASQDVCTFGTRTRCAFSNQISATGFGGEGQGSYTNVSFVLDCEFDSQIAGDFRRLQGCECVVTVTPSNTSRPPKVCLCDICPPGFGDQSIAMDCSGYDGNQTQDEMFVNGTLTQDFDPFIIDQCSSLDCGFGCNGSCRFDCENAGPSCAFCAGANQPTFAPTGAVGSGSLGEGTTVTSSAATTTTTTTMMMIHQSLSSLWLVGWITMTMMSTLVVASTF
jgi:hypothetical protein